MSLMNADKWYAGWAKTPKTSTPVVLSERASLQNGTVTSTVAQDSPKPNGPDENLNPAPSSETDPRPAQTTPSTPPPCEIIAKLTAEVAQLKTANGRLKTEARQKTALMLDHDKLKADLEQTRVDFEREMDAAGSNRRRLEAELEAVIVECSKLRRLTVNNHVEETTDKFKNTILEKHIAALKWSNNSLTEELNTTVTEMVDTQSRLSTMKEEMKTEARKKTALLLDRDKLKADLKKAQDNFATEMNAVGSNRSRLEAELETVREECSKLRQLVETREHEGLKARQTNIGLESQISALMRVKDAIKTQLATKVLEAIDVASKLDGTQNELKAVINANERLKTNATATKKRLRRALRHIKQQESILTLVQSRGKRRRAQMEKALALRDRRITAFESEEVNNRLEGTLHSLKRDLNEKERQLEQSDLEGAQLRVKKDAISAELKQTKHTMASMSKLHDQTSIELASLRLNADTYRVNMDEILEQREARIDVLGDEKLKLQGQLRSMEVELKEKRQEVARVVRQADSYEQKPEIKRRRSFQLELRSSDLAGSRADLERSREVVALVTQLYDENIVKLTAEMADLESSITKRFTELTVQAQQQAAIAHPNGVGRKKSTGGKAALVQKRIDEQFPRAPNDTPRPTTTGTPCGDDDVQVLESGETTPQLQSTTPAVTNSEEKKSKKRVGAPKQTLAAQIEACRSLGISERFVREVRKVTLAEKLKKRALSAQPSMAPSGEGSVGK